MNDAKQGKKLHTVGWEKVPSLVWAEGPRAAISGLEPCLVCELRGSLFSLRTSRMKRAGFGIHTVKTEQKLLYGRKQERPEGLPRKSPHHREVCLRTALRGSRLTVRWGTISYHRRSRSASFP